MFTFDVESGQEIIEGEVFDKDNFGSDDFEGSFQFSLRDYLDQAQHDVWFDLQGPKPNWEGKIRVIIQYVFSKTKMLTGYINMWTE